MKRYDYRYLSLDQSQSVFLSLDSQFALIPSSNLCVSTIIPLLSLFSSFNLLSNLLMDLAFDFRRVIKDNDLFQLISGSSIEDSLTERTMTMREEGRKGSTWIILRMTESASLWKITTMDTENFASYSCLAQLKWSLIVSSCLLS